MGRLELLAFLAVLIFTIFTTVFAANADHRTVRVLPKFAWVLICLFVPLVGGLLYLTVGRPIDDGTDTVPGRRPFAPDDDPDFLRRMAERLKDEFDRNKDSDDESGNK